MNYLLSDDVLKLKRFLGDEQNDALLFYSWHDIRTISDLLKFGEEVRREYYFNNLVESFRRFNIKFDDELTSEELDERNRERKRIEMKEREKRAQNSFEELLLREIDGLRIPNEITIKLKQNQINTIGQLIDGPTYVLFQTDDILKEGQLNRIEDVLANFGLRLNMINPISGQIDKKEEFKKLDEEKMTKVVEKSEEKPRRKVDTEKWEKQFEYLKLFSSYFGHIFIPRTFKENGGIGEWIATQRRAYRGEKGHISEEEIEKLESLGMSWKGTNNKVKASLYHPLNISDIKVKNGVLYTYYMDGTVKTSDDEEFIKMISGTKTTSKVESTDDTEEIEVLVGQAFAEIQRASSVDTETPIETTVQDNHEVKSSDNYSLMQGRIAEMKAKKEAILAENDRKRELIREYRQLIDEFETLTIEGLELDSNIRDLLGSDLESDSFDDSILQQGALTLKDFESIKKVLLKRLLDKRKENERKRALIDEFRSLEAELDSVQSISDELDLELSSILGQSDSHVKKRGEL